MGAPEQPACGIGQLVQYVEVRASGNLERRRAAALCAQRGDVVVRLAPESVGLRASDGAEVAHRRFAGPGFP